MYIKFFKTLVKPFKPLKYANMSKNIISNVLNFFLIIFGQSDDAESEYIKT